jgi:hypothetical protein
MADEKPVDVPAGDAVPLGPLEPVVHPQLSVMGSTLAERKAAREAAEAKASGKQVDEDSAGVEDKAVSRKRTSRK